MKTHSFPHLSPQQYDDIMAHVTAPDADLLALARAVADHIHDDAPDGGEPRRSFTLHETVFVIRGSDGGLPGALWKLCEWLDAHRPVDETPADPEDTQPVDTIGGNV